MPPDKALEYLEAHGLPLSTAVAILQNSTLKQHAAQQQQMQGAQAQQPSVKDKLAQQVKEAADQHAANEARQGGIADLPVPSTMFGNPGASQTVGMARGGIVAFNGNENSLVDSLVQGQHYIPATADINYPVPDVLTDEQKSQLLQQQADIQQRLAAHAATGANFATLPGHRFPSLVGNTEKLTSDLANVNARLQNNVPTYESQAYASNLFSPPYASPNAASVTPVTPAGTKPTVSSTPTSNASSADTAGPVSTRGIARARAGVPDMDTLPKPMQDMMNQTNSDIEEMKGRLQDPHQFLTNHQNMMASLGYQDATDSYKDELEKRKQQTEEYKKQGNWMGIVQMGLGMATAATQNPHGGFLGALAYGGQEGAKQFMQVAKDYRENINKIADQQFVVQNAKNQWAYTQTKDVEDHVQTQTDKLNSLIERRNDNTFKAISVLEGRRASAEYAAAVRNAKIQYPSPQSDVMTIGNNYGFNSPEFKDALVGYTQISRASTSGQNAELSNEEKLKNMHINAYTNNFKYQKLIDAFSVETDPAKRQQLKTQANNMLRNMSGDFLDLSDWGATVNTSGSGKP
jgi:hypothetical protein